MKNFKGLDGLVLCVIGGKIDVSRWISSIDMLNHSIINYVELVEAVNNLINGDLIFIKKDRFVLSKLAKQILRGGFWTGCIEQLTVQKRIQLYSYDETKRHSFALTQEEYDAALKNYQDKMDKIMARMTKY